MTTIDARKDAMLDKAEARLKQIDAEAARLKAKADETRADRRLGLQERLHELKKQRRSFSSQVKELRQASDDALGDLNAGIERAWTEIRNATSRAGDRFH